MSIPLIHVDDLGSVQIQNVTVPNYHVHQPNVNHLDSTCGGEYW